MRPRNAYPETLLASHVGRRIAGRVVVVAGGQTRSVRLVLSNAAGRRLARSTNPRVRLKVVTRAADGPALQSSADVAVNSASPSATARVAFAQPAGRPGDLRAATVDLAQRARSRARPDG